MDKEPNYMFVLRKVRKHGLKALIAYIHKRIRQEFIIIDGQGKEIYTSNKFIKGENIPSSLQGKKEQWYDEKQKKFAYTLNKSGVSLLLAFYPVTKENLPDITSLIDDIRLAFSFYLNTLIEIRERSLKIENDLMENLFGKKRGRLDEFLPFDHFNLNTDKPYVVQLFHLETNDPIIVNNIIDDVVEYTDKNKLPSLRPIYWHNKLVHIIPALYKSGTFELRKEFPEVRISEVFRKSAEKKYNIKISIGLGQIYSLLDLYKSYNEANIALIFRRLSGENGFAQRFTDLGFFRYVFTQDVEVNKAFVMDKLGPIINYDNQKNTDFLNLLRILNDNGFNWKDAAAKCNVHVNTIYYRVERIEKILQINLHDSESKFDVFVALKLWDILNALEVVENYYVGTIEKQPQ